METATVVEDKQQVVESRVTQEITADEKLVLREAENAYLKAQMQITQLSQQTQAAQKTFTEQVEKLGKTYSINPAEMQFDNVALKFVRK